MQNNMIFRLKNPLLFLTKKKKKNLELIEAMKTSY